jgi:excisionase family DNA binding protein
MSKKPAPVGALFVRLPSAEARKLDRAAEVTGIRKKDLVAGLVSKYVDPDSRPGLDALGALATSRAGLLDAGAVAHGSYSYRPYDAPAPPEVMNVEQAADFLQVDEEVVLELVEAGKLPGRKLGDAWRFSRTALVEWLSRPETR